MTFVLPELSYGYDGLEPFIDKETMSIHHTKHHQTYIDKLNTALKESEFASGALEDLLKKLDQIPENIRGAVRSHGGGHYNHSLFRKMMKPGGSQISSPLLEKITESFGGFEQMKKLFNDTALATFGSGWTWLVKKADGSLAIYSTPNQDSPISKGDTELLGVDVWEHAYYLKHQNRRADYLEARWNVIDWDFVASRL
ncbi:MAG TPA: superoxide dismutase [Candidatus Absconditabacterales bacterium]|nr:superoxide dismutase [Candidatus Absconditabacterales bacterium]